MAPNRRSARRARDAAFATDRDAQRRPGRSTSAASAADGVTSTTVSSPLPCSACASEVGRHEPGIGACRRPGSRPRSGPRRWSISTAPRTWRFAAATKALPGPTIFATAGTVSRAVGAARRSPARRRRGTRASVAPAITRAAASAGSPPARAAASPPARRGTPATRAGHRVHQDRRRVGAGAARHVEAGGVERRHDLLQPRAVGQPHRGTRRRAAARWKASMRSRHRAERAHQQRDRRVAPARGAPPGRTRRPGGRRRTPSKRAVRRTSAAVAVAAHVAQDGRDRLRDARGAAAEARGEPSPGSARQDARAEADRPHRR